MNSIVNRLIVLKEFKQVGKQFDLKFLPAFLNVDQKDPILFLNFEPSNPDISFAENFEGLKGQIIENIEVEGAQISLWLDAELEPQVYEGTITWRYEDYQEEDFERIIEHLEQHIIKLNDKIQIYKNANERGLLFIEKSIDRLERKSKWKGFFKHNHRAEIRLLKSVRNQLEQDD